jgi:hypothetical protein
MRVLITGSREVPTNERIFRELDRAYAEWLEVAEPVETFTVVHGCASGADLFGGDWVWARLALERPPLVEEHPADWSKGAIAGHQRNHEMVTSGIDKVIAFYQPGSANRGTRDCVERANTWLAWKGVPIIETWD